MSRYPAAERRDWETDVRPLTAEVCVGQFVTEAAPTVFLDWSGGTKDVDEGEYERPLPIRMTVSEAAAIGQALVTAAALARK
ncbi:hypothetical protein [Amycolatopsis jejuensis]|uniref:hypothetical protein n=1 Tax=Amycolatopsis jejuensis TaxID=330084 RepID=UPI000B2124AD|nr:hypothetical protein [Amycolatopsis jejuensis]